MTEKSGSIFITGYTGLKNSEINTLSQQLNNKKAEHRVIKNTLFRVIAKEAGVKDSEKLKTLKGNSAFVIGGEDVVAVAKVIVDFSKANEKFQIKGLVLDGKVMDSHLVKSLASLPSKSELIAKVVGTIAAPISSLVNVLAANLRNVVGVLSAIKEKKESENKQ